MLISTRSRLLLLAPAVLLPALAAALWWAPPGASPWFAGGVLLLLGLAIGGALGLSRAVARDINDDENTQREARAELERRLEAATLRSREAEQRALHGQRFEALGRLTGAVAHDMNNLLGVISNSAYLIERHGQQQPELQAPLAATMRAVEAGRRLSQHLQRFANRHAGRAERIDLASSLPEMGELLAVVLGKRIAIEVEVAPGTGAIVADPGGLELALINLALNARDALQAAAPEGAHVRLAAGNAGPGELDGLPPGPGVLIRFSDDGQGIDEHAAARAFDPFFTTRPAGQASGLGLAQVQAFCAGAGGRARISGAPGRGTTVSLILPAAPPTPQA
ncbi:sensor histidine kinase [Ideonella sp.]|uniref:sensor histidine kinase n=1 Tax=Ideonella sp. TaxID=1929293 RepID=UPI002B48B1DF|nr:ATP-binding protein [Ideonella sp.]HJV71325.1 ATP-binding protein [Ideonella sp.]